MSATPREQWIAALRSGEFKQGQGRLESSDGALCCLGVACVVAERAGVPVERSADGRLAGANLYAQPPVAEWLGLRLRSATAIVPMFMNDSKGASFEEIADYLEAQGALPWAPSTR